MGEMQSFNAPKWIDEAWECGCLFKVAMVDGEPEGVAVFFRDQPWNEAYMALVARHRPASKEDWEQVRDELMRRNAVLEGWLQGFQELGYFLPKEDR